MVFPCGSNTAGFNVTNTRARIGMASVPVGCMGSRVPGVPGAQRRRSGSGGSGCLGWNLWTPLNPLNLWNPWNSSKHPLEHLIDVTQLVPQVERAVHVLPAQ